MRRLFIVPGRLFKLIHVTQQIDSTSASLMFLGVPQATCYLTCSYIVCPMIAADEAHVLVTLSRFVLILAALMRTPSCNPIASELPKVSFHNVMA